MPRFSFRSRRDLQDDPAAVIGLATRLAQAESDSWYDAKRWEVEQQKNDLDMQIRQNTLAKTQMDLDTAKRTTDESTGATAYFSGLNPSDPRFDDQLADGITRYPHGISDPHVDGIVKSLRAARERVTETLKPYEEAGLDKWSYAQYDPSGKFLGYDFNRLGTDRLAVERARQKEALSGLQGQPGVSALSVTPSGSATIAASGRDISALREKAAGAGLTPEEIQAHNDNYDTLAQEVARKGGDLKRENDDLRKRNDEVMQALRYRSQLAGSIEGAKALEKDPAEVDAIKKQIADLDTKLSSGVSPAQTSAPSTPVKTRTGFDKRTSTPIVIELKDGQWIPQK